MARYALERIPAAEAGKALRDALAKTSGAQKAGVIGSLGARRDCESISGAEPLGGRQRRTNRGRRRHGPGRHRHPRGRPRPAKRRARFGARQAAGGRRPLDRGREAALAAGDSAGAKAVYQSLLGSPAKNIRLAATRGLLLASGKKQ